MKITYIRLENFERFALRESKVFEHHFTKKLTMITGANGAGKSSLFAQLTPLPAERTDFYPGGYKEIHIQKDKKSYVLVSSFKKGAKYSFVCEGEELNPGATVTKQTDLCAIHFGLTASIHDLMTGAESFTEMGLVGRKKLFNSITHLNIDAILQSYNTLKEELKVNEHLLKSFQSRLMQEEQKLLDTTREQHLQDKLVQLQNHIEHLLELHKNLHGYRQAKDIDQAMEAFEHAHQALKNHCAAHAVVLSAYPLPECDVRFALVQSQGQKISQTLQAAYTEMERLLHESRSIEFAQMHSRQELEKEIAHLSALVERVRKGLVLVDPDTPCLTEVSAQVNLLERTLPEMLELFPANPERLLSRKNHERVFEQRNANLDEMHELLKRSSEVDYELLQAKKHQALECPSCHHTWLPFQMDSVIGALASERKVLAEKRLTLQEKALALKAEEERQSSYLARLQEIMALYHATKTALALFWKHVLDKDLLGTRPESIASVITQALAEVGAVQKLHQWEQDKSVLQTNLEMLSVAGVTSKESNTEATAKINETISHLMEALQSNRETLETIRFAKAAQTRLKALEEAVKLSSRTLQSAALKHTVDSVVQQVDMELSLSKVSVIETQNELNHHRAIQSTVASLQGQVLDVQENCKVLTALTEELSPKNGFIAKSVSLFLNAIIGSVNAVISGVWDYKMVLKAIDVETDALNYRFKVEVEDRLTVPDVSKASAGMKEIINLAMKVTLFKLLKLNDHPMYLDEFGVKLDVSHRAKVSNVIFKMLSNSVYSQIFLITHLDLSYGAFKDTEVIEL